MNKKTPSILALGTFDGVHRGHRALIEKTKEIAANRGMSSVVYTFSNHPRSIFADPPDMLQTSGERRDKLESLGVDVVFMQVFDKAFAHLSPEEFVHMLNARFDLQGVVAGFNYTFGVKGLGTVETMQALGKKLGFSVDVVPPVLYKEETVSSTRIRDCILGGRMEDVCAMLVEPYSLTGTIVKNKRIGTSIGFPTANILPPEKKALPKMGVYATMVRVDGENHPAITNVGNNPTVNGERMTIETHLLDVNRDLYGRELTVMFYSFIREERRFENKEALGTQIGADVERTRVILREQGKIV
ncbi:bifunctional riboflavin kinase/FAD synthetase [Christensenellaceae bacterium OttesenSCG-928-M15]|nr:bifunctional riboflavin kinase/FAD synthetase [Christensenellaceae bacterium OttesenSCG-928-M15]